jgi:hypothetical protein
MTTHAPPQTESLTQEAKLMLLQVNEKMQASM